MAKPISKEVEIQLQTLITNQEFIKPISNEILEAMNQLTADVLIQETDSISMQIYKTAYNYLKSIKPYYAIELQLQHKQKLLHSLREEIRKETTNFTSKDRFENLSTTYANYYNQWKTQRDQDNNIKYLYESTIKFQHQLNTYLNQDVKTVFVTDQGEIYQVEEKDIFTKQDYVSGTYASILRAKNLTKQMKRQLQVNKQTISVTAQDQQVFNNLIAKWHACDKKGIYLDSAEKWISVTNLGDIKEAYFAYIIHKKNTRNPELQILYYLSQVTNVSGLLQGDVTVKNIEYAVKSSNASLLGYSQAIELALYIIAHARNGKFSQRALRKYKQLLNKNPGYRNVPNKLLQQEFTKINKKN